MQIRKVQTRDIPKIKAIADSLVVTPENSHRKIGFYVYSLNLEQYRRRSESDLFLVGCRDSELEGFCMAYNSDFVMKLLEQEPQLREDIIFSYLTQLEENYVYIDQLAVRKPKTFSGGVCACGLFDTLKNFSEGKQSIIGATPHSPWKNESSIKFFTHQGGSLVQEIKSKENIVLGIYRLDLV